MKDKFNRVMATGLLALMIAHFSACDNLGQTSSPNTVTNSVEDTKVEETLPNHQGYIPKDLPGDVWKTMKSNGKAYMNENGFDIEYSPIPIKFLQEEGLIYYNENNKLCINGKQATGQYRPFEANVFIDENTDENDVYVLLNYKSDIMISEAAEDVYVTTWKLKYTLDDDDYQALLTLKNDFRQRFFIQDMDNIYEPEVISKCTYAQKFIAINSPFRNDSNLDNVFPYVYIADIDYDTHTITIAAKSGSGYKFYDVNLYETKATQYMMDRYNISKEEALKYVNVESIDTLLGPCLSKFDVGGYDGGLLIDEAEKSFEESTREHKLTNLHVNSQETNFVAAK